MFIRILKVFTTLLLFPISVFAIPQDFDNDGKSDVVYTSASGTSLVWKAKGSFDSSEQINKVFGLATDVPILGNWQSEDTPTIGVVRSPTTGNALLWKILASNGTVLQQEFGKKGDVVISGGDFDGNGITDAAVVRSKDGKLTWQIFKNIFGVNDGKIKKITFGKVGDRALFLSPDGIRDWIGVFGKDDKNRTQLVLKDLQTGKKKIVRRFKRSLASGDRPRPFPLKDSAGIDQVSFFVPDETDTTFYTYNLSGELVRKITLPGLGIVFVGEYNSSQDGEEIGFQTSTEITIYNPISDNRITTSIVSGNPTDSISAQLLN